jgi:hypothetical protein
MRWFPILALLATTTIPAVAQTPAEIARCRSLQQPQQWDCFNQLNAKLKQRKSVHKSGPSQVQTPSPEVIPPSVSAKDNYNGLPFSPREFGSAFDAAAQKIDADQRARLLQCRDGEWSVCTFKVSDLGMVLVTGKTTNGPARDVTMIVGTTEDDPMLTATQGLLDWAVLLAVIDPTMAVSRRGDLIAGFLDRVKTHDDSVKILERGILYTVSAPPNMGIWLSAERASP